MIVLKQLGTGLILITGPMKFNGCPLRRYKPFYFFPLCPLMTQKVVSKISEIWSGMFIPDPNPGSGSWFFPWSSAAARSAGTIGFIFRCAPCKLLQSETTLRWKFLKMDTTGWKRVIFLQCCGFGMFIPDQNFSIPDPGSKIPDPGSSDSGCVSRIRIFLSRIQGQRFRILDPYSHQRICILLTQKFVS